jgi:MazG family protein
MPDPDERPFSPGVTAIFEVVKRLRAPDGCPWDREQTHESLRPYLLEETYELLEAIDSGDDGKIKEELGDLLLQVAMHAEIAASESRFDAAEVSEVVAAKMVARHPHVFGSTKVDNAEDVLRNWEHQKAREARKPGARTSLWSTGCLSRCLPWPGLSACRSVLHELVSISLHPPTLPKPLPKRRASSRPRLIRARRSRRWATCCLRSFRSPAG